MVLKMKKTLLNLSTLNKISVMTDLLIPVTLYFAMTHQFSAAAWLLMGFVVMTRLALVIIAK
jgi:hypothetical protein